MPHRTSRSRPPFTGDIAINDASRALYLRGLALAATGAVFFSAKAIVAKLLYQHGLDAVTLIALRMLLAAPFFLLVGLWSWPRTARPSGRDLALIVLLGLLGYYLSSMLDFLGLQYITAGLERLILFLVPTFVLLLGLLFLRQRVSTGQWMSMVVAYAGIVLVFWHDVSIGSDRVLLGSALVFGSALTYAIYLLLSGEVLKRVGTLALVSGAMLVATLATLIQYAVLRPFPSLFEQTAAVWGLSLLNATLCTVLPVFLTMMAVRRIGAGTTAQTGMIGPVATLGLAWWLLDEPVSALQLGGTGLVLAGIFMLSLRRSA